MSGHIAHLLGLLVKNDTIFFIAFQTDPQTTDYALEAGATRNFEAAKTAEEMAKKEAAAIEEEEANNPMKV